MSVSHYKLAQATMAGGRQELAAEHLARCFAILDAFHRAGRPMDPAMRQLHAALSRGLGEQAR